MLFYLMRIIKQTNSSKKRITTNNIIYYLSDVPVLSQLLIHFFLLQDIIAFPTVFIFYQSKFTYALFFRYLHSCKQYSFDMSTPLSPVVTQNGKKVVIHFRVLDTQLQDLTKRNPQDKNTIVRQVVNGKDTNLQQVAETSTSVPIKLSLMNTGPQGQSNMLATIKLYVRKIDESSPIEQKSSVKLNQKQKDHSAVSQVRVSRQSQIHAPQSLIEQKQVIQNELGLTSIREFLHLLQKDLNSRQAYNGLISASYMCDILHEYDRFYIHHQQISQITDIVLDYMALSHNESHKDAAQNVQVLPTALNRVDFTYKMGERWQKLHKQIYAENKQNLKILDYLVPRKQGQAKYYDHCFLDLAFDFSRDQVKKVSNAVKQLCAIDMRAFCFLTNYLYKCCLKLEQAGAGLKQIQYRLVNTLSNIFRQNPCASPLEGQDQLLLQHDNFSVPLNQIPKKYLDLKIVKKGKRIEALEHFILQRAKQARKNYLDFVDLVKEICGKYGHHFKSGVKIRDLRHKKAVQRVKQKILDRISKKHRSQINLNINPNKNIQQYTISEAEQYWIQINHIFNNLQERIEFDVDDLLRGRCLFSSVDRINECCTELKSEIQKKGYKLISVNNRLRNKSIDLVLNILIGGTIAQMHLVVDFKSAKNEFNYKLGHLLKSKFLSPITTLRLVNEKNSSDYLPELKWVIHINTHAQQKYDYLENTTYDRVAPYFREFIQSLPYQINLSESDPKEIQVNLMADSISRFKKIAQQKQGTISEVDLAKRRKHNGEYQYALNKYQSALQQAQLFKKQIQKSHEHILNIAEQPHSELSQSERGVLISYAQAIKLIAKIKADQKKYDKAVQNFGYYKHLLKKAKVNPNDDEIIDSYKIIGQLQSKQTHYQKSIQSLQKCLALEQKVKGKDSLQYATTLTELGRSYASIGEYSQSLTCFQKCLQIKQKLKGKESAITIPTLSNIASVYNYQNNYPQALKYYKLCLALQQKLKGRDNLDCAATYGNIGLIYEHEGSSYEALQAYEASAKICNKHDSKSLVYANSQFGLGSVYFTIKNYTKAIQFFQNAQKYYETTGGKTDLYFATLSNIAYCYQSLGEQDLCNNYLRKLQEQQSKETY